jgi:hypothetical protein
MDSQQLSAYIKKQSQNGLTKEIITSQLVSQGHKITDIDAAFQLISVPQIQTAQKSSGKKNTAYILISLIAIVCIGMIIIIFSHTNKVATFNKKEAISPVQTITEQPNQQTQLNSQVIKVQPTISENINEATFIAKDGGFKFNYLKTWKVNDISGVAATLTSPDNPNAQECAKDQRLNPPCDIRIYFVHYGGPGSDSLSNQVKETVALRAEKISGPKSATNPNPISTTPVTPVKFGSLSGFEAPTLIYDPVNGNNLTDTIILEGKEHMYVIEFTNETTPKNFDEGRLLILKSFTDI